MNKELRVQKQVEMSKENKENLWKKSRSKSWDIIYPNRLLNLM